MTHPEPAKPDQPSRGGLIETRDRHLHGRNHAGQYRSDAQKGVKGVRPACHRGQYNQGPAVRRQRRYRLDASTSPVPHP